MTMTTLPDSGWIDNGGHVKGSSRIVLLRERGAPPLLQSTMAASVVTSDEELSDLEWLRWWRREQHRIIPLINAPIPIDEELDHLRAFDHPEGFLALSRHHPGNAEFHLKTFPAGAKRCWACQLPPSHQSVYSVFMSLPQGIQGDDNRIPHVNGAVTLSCAIPLSTHEPHTFSSGRLGPTTTGAISMEVGERRAIVACTQMRSGSSCSGQACSRGWVIV